MRMRTIAAVILGLTSGTALLFGEVKQPKVKSQKEAEAVQAMFQAQDPDSRIAAAENLMNKFADSQFKPYALQMEAMSYQQKGDAEKTIIYSERVLEIDPKNYVSMLTLANTIAQNTREFDLDREEKLGRAEKYARSAIDTVTAAEKPRPDLSDENWAQAKTELIAQAHEAIGIANMVRKKWDAAINEFNSAVNGNPTPEPATLVRLGSCYNAAGKPDDAIQVLNKVLAMPNLHPTIKAVAEQERAKASALKARSAGAAHPAAAPSAAPAPAAPKQ